MKTKFYIMMVLITFFVKPLAGKILDGYFITNTNDTVTASFLIPLDFPFIGEPELTSMRFSIRYIDHNNTLQRLKPESTKEFCFIYEGQKILMRSKLVSLRYFEITDTYGAYHKNEFVFLKVINSGYLSLYYFRNPSKYRGATYALQKGNDNLFFSGNGCNTQLIYYFSDCPELAERIRSQKVTLLDQMVSEYNNHCSQNAKPSIEDFNKTIFYQSKSHFIEEQSTNFTFEILKPIDVRGDFIGENLLNKKNQAQYIYPWTSEIQTAQVDDYPNNWTLPLANIVQNKLRDELNLNRLTNKPINKIFIQPIIEVFFVKECGVFGINVCSKTRVKFILYDSNCNEFLTKTCETVYYGSRNVLEEEGPYSIPDGSTSNINLGICLRKTLDVFYSELKKSTILHS